MLLSGIIAALTSLLIPIIILLLLLPNACYVVEQQHAVIIERLGKFNRIVNAGFHMKVPVIDRKAATVSLRTRRAPVPQRALLGVLSFNGAGERP